MLAGEFSVGARGERTPDRWIRWATTVCVAFLALIVGTVSYLHMHLLVELRGQPGWVAALTPLSVDGMIVAASATLLADSRVGERGEVLPWTLLLLEARRPWPPTWLWPSWRRLGG